MDVTEYVKKEIKACNYMLEKEYQNCPDVVRVAELEARIQAFTEVLYILENKNAPGDEAPKGKVTL